MHCLQSWPPGCVTCVATLPWIALLALSVSIELVSSSARFTSVKFQQPLFVSDLERLGPIDRTPGIPGLGPIKILFVQTRTPTEHQENNIVKLTLSSGSLSFFNVNTLSIM